MLLADLIEWSFKDSTTPTLAATMHTLLPEVIFVPTKIYNFSLLIVVSMNRKPN